MESASLTWMPPPCSGSPPSGSPLWLITDRSIVSPDDAQIPAPAEVTNWRALGRLVSFPVMVDRLTTRSPQADEAIPPPRTAALSRMVESSTVTSAPNAARPPPLPESATTTLSSSTTSRRVRLTADGSAQEPVTRMPAPSPENSVPPVTVRPWMTTTTGLAGSPARLRSIDSLGWLTSKARSPIRPSPANVGLLPSKVDASTTTPGPWITRSPRMSRSPVAAFGPASPGLLPPSVSAMVVDPLGGKTAASKTIRSVVPGALVLASRTASRRVQVSPPGAAQPVGLSTGPSAVVSTT